MRRAKAQKQKERLKQRLQLIDTPKQNSHIFFGESLSELKELSRTLESEEKEIEMKEADFISDPR